LKILFLPNQYSQQRQREKKRWIYPVHLAMEAEHYRQVGHDVTWATTDMPVGHFYDGVCYDKIIRKPGSISFLRLPAPDRIFTDAFDKRYQQNGNFKYHPGTYMQVANGCWHGQCTFCVEQKNEWEVRPVADIIEELARCEYLGFKEVFDDSGTFPTSKWLDDFLSEFFKERNKRLWDLRLGCNMRMVDVDYFRMAQAGFRMVLFGLESANQATLDKINKGVRVDDYKYIIKAAKAGLEPHVAVMFGYPWERDCDALETLRLVHWLLKKGYAKTAQASFYIPPDSKNIPSHNRYIKHIYRVARSPEFWLNKLRDIHDMDDLKYLWRQIKEGMKNV